MQALANGWFDRRRTGILSAREAAERMCGTKTYFDLVQEYQAWARGEFERIMADQKQIMAAPKSCNDVVTAVIAVGFAVTILRSNRMRSLSVAAIFVVGCVLSAEAQTSTPATQVAPNLKPPEPDNSARHVTPNLEFLSQQPNLESLSEEPDNPAMQTLKSLAPELENPTTQAIPNPSAPIRPKTR
jgi:hypothetical protein